MRAPVPFVRPAFNQAGPVHPLQQGSHRIGIAAHELGQIALGQPPRVPFQERPHHRELVRRDAQVGDSPAKGLVQTIPGPAQQRRQPAATG